MINKTILVGRITKQPELKHTQSNIAVVTFTLAVNRPFSNGDGEKETDFIQCVVWRKQAENLARFVSKGDLIGVDGRISTRNYETAEGTRYVTEVVCDSVQFLSTKSSQGTQDVQEPSESYDSKEEFYEATNIVAEDLPF